MDRAPVIRVRLGPLCRGLLGLVAIGALVGGVPYVLVRFIGWPLPRHVPTWHEVGNALSQHGLSDTAILDVLSCALWLCWAVLMLAFLTESIALMRSRAVGRLPVAGRFQGLAAFLLGTIVLTLAASFARGGGSGVSLPRVAITTPVRPPVLIRSPFGDGTSEHDGRIDAELTAVITDDPTRSDVPMSTSTSRPSERTYVVRGEDTLWGIAERELGDPLSWRAIFELNKGVPQPGGGALQSPHWIYPGWVLRLPSSAPASSSPDTHPTPAPAATTTTEPPTTTPTEPTTTTAPNPTSVEARGPIAAPSSTMPAGPSTTPARSEPPTRANRRTGDNLGHVPGHPGANRGEGRRGPEPAAMLSATDRVGGSLVVAILGALVALRLRRRQRYRPRAPWAGRHLGAPALTPTLRDLLVARRAEVDDDADFPSESVPEVAPLSGVVSDEAFAAPDRIEAGTVEEGWAAVPVELSLGRWSGLVLSGAGGEATLRGWLAALLARSGPFNVQIVTTPSCARRLLSGLDLARTVQLRDDLAALFASVEAEFVDRTRRIERDGLADATDYRGGDDPYPFLVALVDAVPAEERGRWRVLAESAGHLAACALALDIDATEEEEGPRLVVDADGWVEHAAPQALADLLGSARCFALGSDEAADLLAPIAAVHNYSGPEDEPDAADRAPEETNGDGRSEWPMPQLVASTVTDAIEQEPVNDQRRDGEVLPEPAAVPIRVQLLGVMRVVSFGVLVEHDFRASGFELLAWYALRPEGARREVATEALWPDRSPRRGHDAFWNALGSIRSRLGRPEGSDEKPLDVIAKVGDLYVPDAAVLDIDLWQFEAGLAAAARATNDDDRIIALTVALDSYGGTFCPGTDYLWSEPAREDLHRRALDAACRLAELHEQAGRNEEAVVALRRALTTDPICEEVVRRIGRLLEDLGRVDEALAVRDELHAHLDEADLDSSRATDALFGEMRRRRERIAEVRRRRETGPNR